MGGSELRVRGEGPPLSEESSKVADVPQRQEPVELNRASGNDAPRSLPGGVFQAHQAGRRPRGRPRTR